MYGDSTVPMPKVGQCLDDTALLHVAAHALAGHPLQFRSKRLEALHPGVHLGDVGHGDGVCCRAVGPGTVGEGEQGADVLHGEAEFAGMANEAEPPEVGIPIGAVPALGSGGRRQPALGLVLADRGRLHPGLSRQVADRQPRHGVSSIRAIPEDMGIQ